MNSLSRLVLLPLGNEPFVAAVGFGNLANAHQISEGGIDALRAYIAEVTQDTDLEVVSTSWMSYYRPVRPYCVRTNSECHN